MKKTATLLLICVVLLIVSVGSAMAEATVTSTVTPKPSPIQPTPAPWSGMIKFQSNQTAAVVGMPLDVLDGAKISISVGGDCAIAVENNGYQICIDSVSPLKYLDRVHPKRIDFSFYGTGESNWGEVAFVDIEGYYILSSINSVEEIVISKGQIWTGLARNSLAGIISGSLSATEQYHTTGKFKAALTME